MATRKPDRRVERTRAQLHEALLALVVERGYQAITVQNILDRANIGRSTFYLHFRDKDDLLLIGMEPLREALMRVVKSHTAGADTHEYLAFTPEFFRHGEAYREAYKALTGSARIVAEQQVSRMIIELVHEDLKIRARASKSDVPMEAAAQCVAGAVMGLVAWWIAQKHPVPPEEVNRICLALLRPAMEHAFG